VRLQVLWLLGGVLFRDIRVIWGIKDVSKIGFLREFMVIRVVRNINRVIRVIKIVRETRDIRVSRVLGIFELLGICHISGTR
jgi:hypothetical protein